MYPRRAHTKSRNGCGQCKRAHIKCDLQAPLCSQCARKKRACDYQHLSAMHRSPIVASKSAMVLIPAIRYRIPQLPVSPITLLSLFEYEVQIWESKLGQVHDQHFVQHGILAISALYIDTYCQNSHSPISKTALFHQLEASRLFRQTISEVTEENWLAVLVFAVALSIFHFCTTSKAPEGCILETMLLLRNSAPLGLEIGAWMDQSGLKTVLSAKQAEYKATISVDDVKAPLEAIQALESSIILSYNTGIASLAYQQAISALKKWLSWTEGRPHAWIHLVWWPAAITTEYMTLLAENEDGALLIFVYWCAIMKNAPQRWYLQGWAQRVGASAFHRISSPSWHLLLKWAITTLGIDFSWLATEFLIESIQDN
ncbi:hypothetical protein N431DRAFT_542616 [Stipitochalara longipes BDJ]|nr:hypothetical protein N431DRAFT_542616 [Stipitochalara longipes BDJ]